MTERLSQQPDIDIVINTKLEDLTQPGPECACLQPMIPIFGEYELVIGKYIIKPNNFPMWGCPIDPTKGLNYLENAAHDELLIATRFVLVQMGEQALADRISHSIEFLQAKLIH